MPRSFGITDSSGSNRIDAVTPVLAVHRRADEAGEGRHRIRCVPAQRPRQWRQVVAAITESLEDATTDQRAQQSAQCISVGPDPVCQFVDPKRLRRKGVGDAEVRGDGDALGHPRRGNELPHHCGCGGQRLVQPQKMITDPLHRECEPDGRNLGGELHRVSSRASSDESTIRCGNAQRIGQNAEKTAAKEAQSARFRGCYAADEHRCWLA